MGITEADKVEMRRLHANKGMTTREIAKIFKIHHSTVARVLKTCDAVSATAPSRTKAARVRGATPSDKKKSQSPKRQRKPVAPVASLELPREQPKTEVLQASARIEAADIMERLDELLQGQMSRLQAVQDAEAEFKTSYLKAIKSSKEKKDIPGRIYQLVMKMNQDHNEAIEGVQRTLSQMASLHKNIVMYFDNRQVNIQNIGWETREKVMQEFIDDIIIPALKSQLPRAQASAVAAEVEQRWEQKRRGGRP